LSNVVTKHILTIRWCLILLAESWRNVKHCPKIGDLQIFWRKNAGNRSFLIIPGGFPVFHGQTAAKPMKSRATSGTGSSVATGAASAACRHRVWGFEGCPQKRGAGHGGINDQPQTPPR